MFIRAGIWLDELVPGQWGEGLTVNRFMKGDKEDPRQIV